MSIRRFVFPALALLSSLILWVPAAGQNFQKMLDHGVELKVTRQISEETNRYHWVYTLINTNKRETVNIFWGDQVETEGLPPTYVLPPGDEVSDAEPYYEGRSFKYSCLIELAGTKKAVNAKGGKFTKPKQGDKPADESGSGGSIEPPTDDAPVQGTPTDGTTPPPPAKPAPAAPAATVSAASGLSNGWLVFNRPANMDSGTWGIYLSAFKQELGTKPYIREIKENGDELRLRFEGLPDAELDALSKGSETYLKILRDPKASPAEPASPAKPAAPPKPPAYEGNGDADLTQKDVPGSGPSVQTTLPSAPKTKTVYHEHWFDPTDKDAKKKDPFIYIRIDGQAERVQLSDAKYRNLVPPDATPATMTNYSERKKEILDDKGTHDSLGGAPRSTNKFAKPPKK